ncbi:TonB-dependent receptor plug domain-containing protein [Aquimarina brevivitae]|uniref:Outer membrane receptor for ferrienterochelin and colicin n=1 Tax=Aquimarina brevivitae TaxID=323412 RepID=A0A4Q7P0P9_9FLAO|nr:TonB-dependent receptor plug domain-containing protein [Aquimarina brevivitae]RZS93255.1 outer membrane receptor for ferrienterochelin and colicin [Aquimarina brevivitae]
MTKYLCVFLIVCSIKIYSQNEDNATSFQNEALPSILDTLQDRFNIKFSYLDEAVAARKVNLTLVPNGALEPLLDSLEKQTGLKFIKTSDTFYTVRAFMPSDTIAICGYLLSEIEEPLSDIEIFIKETKTYLYTDSKGYFSGDNIPYGSAILVSATGFRQRVLRGKAFIKEDCPTFILTESIQELDEVLIQEYISTGITKTGNEIKIDLDDVSILPGLTEPDILQAIQLIPGINSPFETASGIYIRGSAPHQNLVLWNGIKTYHQGHMFGMISAFNPYVVDQVNIYKSGVDPTYGDRIAGVIDIQSDTAIPEYTTGNAGINLVNADAVVHTPIIKDQLSLQVSGRRSYTDLVETPTFDQLSDRVFQNTTINTVSDFQNDTNDFYYEDYSAQLNANLSTNSKLNFSSLYSTNNLNFERRNDTLTLSDELRTENEGYRINWEYQPGRKRSYQISSYYSKYLLDYQFITDNMGVLVENERKNNSVRDYGAKITTTYSWSEYSKFTSGLEYSNNAIRYAFVTTTPNFELVLDEDDRTLNTYSVFANYSVSEPKSYRFAVGARLNYYEELDQIVVEPRLQYQKHLNNYWLVHTTAEYRTQAVSQIRESVISDLALENQIWTLADRQEFPLVTSYQLSTGSTFTKDKWFIDAEAYYRKIDDITTLTAGFINPIDNTYNQGSSSIFGADIFIKKHFENYKSWISYSYINSKNQFEAINNNSAFPGNWNIEHTIKWSHFYETGDFQFTLGWLWHTGKVYTNVAGVTQEGEILLLDYNEINGSTLPLYHRLDFSATYDFTLGSNKEVRYRLGASILNLYDRENILNREFRISNSFNTRFINDDMYSLGITPNVSFRIFW